MSDLFENLACELNKNNVSIEIHRVASPNLLAIGENIVEEKIILDFSEHDKVFEDKIAKLEKEVAEWKAEAREIKKNRDEQLKSFRKAVEPYVDILHMHETIAELKQRIAELESIKMENFSEIDTSNPLACAESLIEHMTHCEKFMIMPERDVQTFSVEELKEIADYLMVYYKHHKDRDAETISF